MEIDEPTKQLLSQMGFEPQAGQPKLYSLKIDEETEASVDFRKVNGRRFARRKEDFVDDPDTIPILKAFKEARDKLQSSSTEPNSAYAPKGDRRSFDGGTPDTLQSPASKNGDTGNGEAKPVGGFNPPLSPGVDANKEQAGTTKEKPNYQPPPEKTPPAPSNNQAKEIYDFLERLAENDTVEFYGKTGVGKSKLMVALATMAKNIGKKVKYIDTEHNITRNEIFNIGSGYQFCKTLSEVMKAIASTPKDTDMIILDSVGFPRLAAWGKLKPEHQHLKGQLLSEVTSCIADLKYWAIENNKLALFTNQPESEMNKTPDKDGIFHLDPSVDKAGHASKEVLEVVNIFKNKIPPVDGRIKTTRSWVKVNKSRRLPDIELFQINITSEGTTISTFDKERVTKYFVPSE